MSPDEVPPLDSLEIASGTIKGTARGPARSAAPAHPGTPREALDSLLLPALQRSPCLVAFSGGRDSSGVLAAAVAVAREHGLPLPTPITMRHAGVPATEESEWQALVLRHLGLTEHEIIEPGDAFDLLGPLGRSVLRAHGLLWPPNVHVIVPFLRAASGGALITGTGGDEVLDAWARERSLKHRAARRLPRRAAVAILARRRSHHLPWMTEEGLRRLERRTAEATPFREPSWAASMEAYLASRYRELHDAAFTALAADAGTELVNPLADPAFVRALVAHAPREGFADRTAAIRAVFGGLLPPEVVERATKASFTTTLWGPDSRRFAAGWDGTGLDPELVDPPRLRAEWMKPGHPDYRALPALQAAWLTSRA